MTAGTGEPAGHTTDAAPTTGRIPADTFGLRLVIARYDAGRLSIERAAAMCGLNSENWRRWEDGAMPRDKVDVVEAIVEGLEIDGERIDGNWLLFGGQLRRAARPAKRVRHLTPEYLSSAVRLTASKPIDLSAAASSSRPDRRPRMVDRVQPAAA